MYLLIKPNGFSITAGLALALLMASSLYVSAAPPDLTSGGVSSSTITTNLGPTGLRGWVYHENIDTSASRQIQIQAVDAGSPADGILAVNDVILGASGTGAAPVDFTADARVSIANAINDAEARNPAELKVLRWRAGTTTVQTITLRFMGAYSATAPYNCPKSAKILEEGLQAIMATGETAGEYSLGTLSLLAANDTANPNNAARQARAQAEARALIPDAATLAKMSSGEPDPLTEDPWGDGPKLIVLTEYYLQTRDALVLPAIEAYSKAIIGGQNLFGTYSHRYARKWRDGSPNGPMRNFYGTVNSASMPGWLGLLLTKECGIVNPDLDPAIERASRFYAYYSGKGAIPYGEHDAYWQGHESNGKSGLAALCFELESHRATQQKFFAKMAVAATSERDIGHTGPFFNHLWAPLGAAVGGEAAAASHFSRVRWMLDLNRRWDGLFISNRYGEDSIDNSYSDFRISTAALLTYALPLRQLHITGRGHDPLRQLTNQDVAEAEAVDGYRAASRTTGELMADLGSWSPRAQRGAAEELKNRPSETAALLPTLHAMATDPLGTSRVGATFALGYIGHASSAGILASLLTDPVNHVRFAAADALREMPQNLRAPHLNTVLAAAAANAAPLLPFNEEDPAHLAHARFGPLLFNSDGMVPTDLSGVDRNLLYPAIRAVAQNPVGHCRSSLSRIYDNLNQTDYQALVDTVVYSAYELTPADKMFAYEDRNAAQRVLEKYKAAEGVPLCLLAINDNMIDSSASIALSTLQLYAGGSKTVQPDPDVEAAMNFLIQTQSNVAEAQAVLAAIAGDPNPLPLQPLKSIQSTTADAPTLTLPVKSTTLRVAAVDLAKGDSIYTWRKIHGAGNVIFAPNGTSAAKDAAVIFDGTPGRYLFEVKMSDSRNLTEATSTVAVTLLSVGGTLPTNNPPVANNQTLSVPQATATPITLTGSDPEGISLLYRVAGQPAHGRLTGTAPYLSYTSDFSYTGPDAFTFEVTDSEGQISTATVNITVTAASSFPVAVYEPFNMTAGSLLEGQAGGVGLLGNWRDSFNLGITAGSLSYGSIPTSGNRLLRPGSNSPASINLSTTLADAGLLNDGAVLWFSFLHREPDNINTQPAFLFGNHGFADYFNDIANSGSGIGVRIGSGDSPRPIIFNAGTYSEGAVQGTIPTSQTALIVAKITWGATPSTPDTIEIYTPHTDLALDTPTSLSAVLDQSNFNVLSFWGNGPCPEFDEIRFGANYASVLIGNTAMTADATAPTPSSSSFHQAPAADSPSSIRMVAVTAFDPNDVEYYFTCTAGGGDDSGWQDSPIYTDTDLTPGVSYSYNVKARDKSPARNETTPSSAASATISTQATLPNLIGMQRSSAEAVISAIGMSVGAITLVTDSGLPAGTVFGQTPTGDQIQALGTAVDLVVSGGDFTAPTPSPASFSVVPIATSSSVITMTATTGSDPSGVEYLFTETSGNPGGTSSNWQDSPTYTDTGLSAATQYGYTVTIRDKSPNANATSASATASAITTPIPAAPTWFWDGGTNDIATDGNGASAGGSGTWNTTLRNWDGGNTAHTEWNNAALKSASFGGAAGTVTLGTGGVAVGGVRFDSANYIIGSYPVDPTTNEVIPNGGEPVTFGTSGTIHNDVAASIHSPVAGSFGLNKTGTGLLELRNINNTFSGNINVGAGTLRFGSPVRDNALATRLGDGNFSGNIAIATGSSMEFWTTTSQAFSGIISGGGNVIFRFNPDITLSGANTYTGKTLIGGQFNGDSAILRITSLNKVVGGNPSSSLGAPTTVANGTIELGAGGAQAAATLIYTGAGETTDRVINIVGGGSDDRKITNNGGHLTFTSPFTGANSGGSITFDGSGVTTLQNFNLPQVRSLRKFGSGTVNLSGLSQLIESTELYGGTLGLSGEINDASLYYGEDTGVFTRPTGKPANQMVVPNSALLAVGMTVYGRFIPLDTTITQIIDATTIQTSEDVGNGGLLNRQSDETFFGFRGSLGLTNRLRFFNSATIRYDGPNDFTNRGFEIDAEDAATWDIAGGITLGLSGSTNAESGRVAKAGNGKLVLSGNLLHSGSPNIVSAGTLLIDGNATAMTGSVEVANAASFGGKGTLGGNLNIAAGGSLTFDLSTPAASHDRLDLSTGKTLTFSGASTLIITSTAGASPGLYTLVSGGNNIVGPVPATIILPVGWSASPQIVGNELRLNVTSTTGSAYDVWKTAHAPGGNSSDDFDGDGVENAVEFVLGGTSATNDSGKLPVISTSGSDMLFTFYRAQNSIDPKTSTVIEVSTNLETWDTDPSPYLVPDVATTANPGVSVEKNNPSAGADKITLRVPQSPATKKFARLKVMITP
jgi:autotransporter-associated beta strand protein